MDNFSRKSLSKYLMKTVDFNKHEMTRGKNTLATIQNYKTISSPESPYACNVCPGSWSGNYHTFVNV
jgi:hypothetical protein